MRSENQTAASLTCVTGREREPLRDTFFPSLFPLVVPTSYIFNRPAAAERPILSGREKKPSPLIIIIPLHSQFELSIGPLLSDRLNFFPRRGRRRRRRRRTASKGAASERVYMHRGTSEREREREFFVSPSFRSAAPHRSRFRSPLRLGDSSAARSF